MKRKRTEYKRHITKQSDRREFIRRLRSTQRAYNDARSKLSMLARCCIVLRKHGMLNKEGSIYVQHSAAHRVLLQTRHLMKRLQVEHIARFGYRFTERRSRAERLLA